MTERQGRIAGKGWFTAAQIEQYPLWGVLPTWLVMGGRGAGKTRLGAEWINALVEGISPFSDRRKHLRIALVGETLGDVREVMVEGPSGIIASARFQKPRLEASRRRLVWPKGAVAYMFSSEDPESLRGPQFDAAWCDELGKWRHAQATFDMLQFGLRLGERPSQLITTTPRPTALIKRLAADPSVSQSRLRTLDNAGNLAKGFIETVERRYGGTRLGRQELGGELIEDREDALWSRAGIEAGRGPMPAELGRIVVAVDPPAGSGRRSDACGIVAAGLEAPDRAVVLADRSASGLKPQQWAARALALHAELDADAIVAEVNQGGEMVEAVIRQVDPTAPVRTVRANRGKWLRAEPVAALYAQGRVRHPQALSALEDEMCDFGPEGLSDGRSPDRVDALVWAITELLLGRGGRPRIRGFG